MLFSATLTNNPKKLSALMLSHPTFFSATKELNFSMPESLEQKMLVCELSLKPLYVQYLIAKYAVNAALCFTKSVESTHRLYLLLKTLLPSKKIVEYSGQLSPDARNKIIEDFAEQKIDLYDLNSQTTCFSYPFFFLSQGYLLRCDVSRSRSIKCSTRDQL